MDTVYIYIYIYMYAHIQTITNYNDTNNNDINKNDTKHKLVKDDGPVRSLAGHGHGLGRGVRR